jgi:sugar/nucleoside kinase (ribokinase family)
VKVLGFGDNVIDRFLDRRIDYPGGNCVNFAVFARRLGLDAGYLGVFGSDTHGETIREVLESLGIDVSRCVVREGETGLARVEVVDGDRVFRGGNGGGVSVREPVVLTADLLAYASAFALVHSSVYSSSESELPKLSGAGPLVSYDVSSEDEYRAHAYLGPLAPHLDLVLASCSHLSGEQTMEHLERIHGFGAGLVLGTRGAEGAVLFDGARHHVVAAVPVDAAAVRDTMGCGDAFLAGFVDSLLAAGWRRGVTPASESIEAALAAGAQYASDQLFTDGAFGYGKTVLESLPG